MGDHFVLLVDRLLTESTLEAAIESRNRSIQAAKSAAAAADDSSKKVDFGDISSPRKLVECKICHDEDRDSNMETPCSCSGSLKYAHRSCVQRWCNEKGDTICEICHQQFKPGYTVPPPLFQFGRIPMHFRGNWEITRRDINSPRIIAMVSSSERNFLDPEFDDYSASSTRSLTCCRTMAVIFMILLILRHTLPLIINGKNDYSFPLIMLLFLRTIGIVLPIYVMVRAVSAIHQRRRRSQQVLPISSPDTLSDGENEDLEMQRLPHIIQVN
ncbi:uncharacterized protein LOC133822656 [Humulus lupulus]|uniref:uncharacterized protein LOC133822656 n=1 Tax=Humulus lupulus TaxID=3486 RepID=UPI002B4100B7|nr:uncharacterized protein LOC133822656 [Humulus lupulus]XP_062111047.1 uncharacterized protein LOC133822656 [Humulus lupulus]XP_062111048.1 uncharacterized protein LOC133822656 [Humulus lupulus]